MQSSASIPAAAFEAPVYTAEKTGIQITAGETKTLEEDIVCKLNEQVKVSVEYNDLFKEHIVGSGNTTVTISGNQTLNYPITYTNGTLAYEKQNGFFKVAPSPATTSMEITVNVLMKVKKEGSTEYETANQKMTATVTGVAACQWRQIKFAMQEDKNGNASFSVNIGDLEADIPLEVEATTSEDQILGEDPLAPKSDGDIRLLNTAGLTDYDDDNENTPTIPKKNDWNSSFTFGNPSFAPTKELEEGEVYTDMDIDAENTRRENMVIVIDENLETGSVVNGGTTINDHPLLSFQAVVPNGIKEFKVKIISDIIEPLLLILPGITDTELDLIGEPEQVIKIANILPFPYHDPDGTLTNGEKKIAVKRETVLNFDLALAVPILQDLFTEEEGKEPVEYHIHNFQMTVKDEANFKKEINLKLKVMNPNYNK